MFGHTDWEFVDSKILRRHDDENYTVILFHHEDTREGGVMAKPKMYTMFVSFSAMDMEQAIDYIHELDDKDIRSCLEEE